MSTLVKLILGLVLNIIGANQTIDAKDIAVHEVTQCSETIAIVDRYLITTSNTYVATAVTREDANMKKK